MSDAKINKVEAECDTIKLKSITVSKGKMHLTEDEYESLLDKLYEIPLVDGETIWPSLDECLRYENSLPLKKVIIFYVWLQELNRHPEEGFRATLDHIDDFLDEHLIVSKEKNH